MNTVFMRVSSGTTLNLLIIIEPDSWYLTTLHTKQQLPKRLCGTLTRGRTSCC
jgi:hypothetical protein